MRVFSDDSNQMNKIVVETTKLIKDSSNPCSNTALTHKTMAHFTLLAG
jgi:hypothetical protein